MMRQVAISIRSYTRAGNGRETKSMRTRSLIMPRNAFEECEWCILNSPSFQAHTRGANEVAEKADRSVFQEDISAPAAGANACFQQVPTVPWFHIVLSRFQGLSIDLIDFKDQWFLKSSRLLYNTDLRAVFWSRSVQK